MDFLSSSDNSGHLPQSDQVLIQSLSQFFAEYNTPSSDAQKLPRFVLGLSGGMDSVVLLDLLADCQNKGLLKPNQLLACYIDHQLQSQSGEWRAFCKTLCENYQIRFTSIEVELDDSSRQGIEQRARKARYAALFSLCAQGDFLLTAHHARDQAETLLLNLMRGAGVRGLGAMPPLKTHQINGRQIHQARPLLSCDYSDIASYAQRKKLTWIEDPSNQDVKFRRNWVRLGLLPLLKEAYPEIEQTLLKTANRLQEADKLLNRLAQRQLNALNPSLSDSTNALQGYCHACQRLQNYCFTLPPEIHTAPENLDGILWFELKNMLRFWSEQQGLPRFVEAIYEWLLKEAYIETFTEAYKDAEKPISENKNHRNLNSTAMGAIYMGGNKIVKADKTLKLNARAKYHLPHNHAWCLYSGKLYFVAAQRTKQLTLAEFFTQMNVMVSQDSSATKFELWCYANFVDDVRLVSLQWVRENEKNIDTSVSELSSKNLKAFFQKHQIPLWERNGWPVLVVKVQQKWQVIGFYGHSDCIKIHQSETLGKKTLLTEVFYHHYLQLHRHTLFKPAE